jgi:predicted DCC family thiol-disulfide oxidoreductase YuxK
LKVVNALKNKTILFDAECPMCAWYTGEFVKHGVLESDGRIPWSQMDAQHAAQVDRDRSRNEIALVDLKTGETLYGIDAMFAMTGALAPVLKPVLRFPAFRFMMKGVYKLITFNRRMMAGGKPGNPATECEPDFNLTWRVIYLGLSLLLGAAAWFGVGNHLFNGVEAGWQLLAFAATGWFAMGATTLVLPFRARMEYLGNLATLLNISSLLLLPGLLLNALAGVALPGLMILNALFAHTVIFLAHERRIAKLGLSYRWQWVWLVISASSLSAWATYFGWIQL